MVRTLFMAVFLTLFWVVVALVRPLPNNRWFQTFALLAWTAVLALGIAANRLRKRHRHVSLKK